MKRIVNVAFIMSLSFILTGCVGNPSEEGIELLKEGNYKEAEDKFEEAIEKEINVGDAYRGVGIVKWEENDYEGAREAFLKALKYGAKETGTIYNFLGNCELEQGNYTEALDYYQQGLTQKENSEGLVQEMKFNIIVAYEKIKDFESAKTELEKYLENYPEDEKAQKELEFLRTR